MAELGGAGVEAFFGKGLGEPTVERFRGEGNGVACGQKCMGLIVLGEGECGTGGDLKHAVELGWFFLAHWFSSCIQF